MAGSQSIHCPLIPIIISHTVTIPSCWQRRYLSKFFVHVQWIFLPFLRCYCTECFHHLHCDGRWNQTSGILSSTFFLAVLFKHHLTCKAWVGHLWGCGDKSLETQESFFFFFCINNLPLNVLWPRLPQRSLEIIRSICFQVVRFCVIHARTRGNFL